MKHVQRLAFGVLALAFVSALAVAQERTKIGGKDAQSKPVDPKAPAATDAKAAEGLKGADAELARAQRPSYPLTKCAVAGEELKPGETVELIVQGRLVRLCCSDCAAKVGARPDAVIQKINEAVVAAQKSAYPMTVCAVTGEKLADKAVDHVYGTRLVRLANAEAVAAFEKDPKTFMAKVDKALIDAQRATYPTKSCVVSGEAIEGNADMTPVDYLYGTKLVRFCCRSCVRSFQKDPDTFLKKLASAQ